MSNKIELADIDSQEKLTARLWIRPVGESGYIDVGNVSDYNHAEAREYRTHMAAEGGFRYVNNEQVDTVHKMYEFTLSEREEYNERLIALAESSTAANQDAATAATETFQDVTPGRSYFFSRRPVSNVTVEVSSVTITEAGNYELDLDTGRLKILEGGDIEAGDDVDVQYDAPARGFQQYAAMSQPLFRGDVRLEEISQLTREPLRVIEGRGNISLTAFPEQSGEFGTYTARLTFTDKPVITKRNQADALTPDAAGSGS